MMMLNNFHLFRSITIFALLFVFSEEVKGQRFVSERGLTKISGNTSSKTEKSVAVYVFFSVECPVCIASVEALKKLDSLYTDKGLELKIIYSGTYYSDEEIQKFHRESNWNTSIYKDDKYRFANRLKATVTPSAFVFNAKGENVYSGKINNRYESVGRRRAVISERYLQDAIDATLQNELPKIRKTDAVGCFMINKM